MCAGNSVQSIPPRRSNTNQRRTAPITHVQAQEAALRLIHSHFGQRPHARMSIPAQLDDDDILIMDYIEQQVLQDCAVTPSLSYQLATAAKGLVHKFAVAGRIVELDISDFRWEFEKVLKLDHYTGEQAEAILPKEQ